MACISAVFAWTTTWWRSCESVSCTTSKSPVKSSAARPQGFTHLGVELSRLSSRVIAGAACTETTSKITKRLPNPESQIEHSRNDYMLTHEFRYIYIIHELSSIHLTRLFIILDRWFDLFLFIFLSRRETNRKMVGKRGKSSWINLFGTSILLFPIHG